MINTQMSYHDFVEELGLVQAMLAQGYPGYPSAKEKLEEILAALTQAIEEIPKYA